MSVLIKGMEKPKDCESCTVAHLADCELWIKAGYRQRHKNCPLIEVPPHGRLIDGDALLNMLQEILDKADRDARFSGNRVLSVGWDDAIRCIKVSPTIIEAEEEQHETN